MMGDHMLSMEQLKGMDHINIKPNTRGALSVEGSMRTVPMLSTDHRVD
jgi:hypothetical protein